MIAMPRMKTSRAIRIARDSMAQSPQRTASAQDAMWQERLTALREMAPEKRRAFVESTALEDRHGWRAALRTIDAEGV